MNDQQIIDNLTEKLEEAHAEILALKNGATLDNFINNINKLAEKAKESGDVTIHIRLAFCLRMAEEFKTINQGKK